MNDINLVSEEHASYGFIPASHLRHDETEYHFRDKQLRGTGKDPSTYRRLKTYELETLVKNENTCADWSMFLVSDPFTPELIKNNTFSGLIRIARLERKTLEHHDLHMMTGITNSRIIACDVGENCAIHDCAYMAHYIVGDNCLLLRNDEIHVSNHSKFGNGIVMEGESESIRIEMDLMNEAGGRSVLPFDGMLAADAYLWARYRDRPALMGAFRTMTENLFEHRFGSYGMIGRSCVLKSNRIMKDVLIGDSAYIKGTNKLKNLTVNSSEVARTQIGEGVELVNGIIGYGCRIFYGCKAVRFVMGDNSALKYGARLIHSVLGDNSTVSCCELLNNLIFPSHEQHHNTSFLIASLVRGQSNMAAGATVGSNHNSRAPDGEIEAGRGFWPGLTVSLKHSSRFASFCLIAKGDYRFELDIPLPFCLVDDDRSQDRLILVPAYWWTHNQYALMRNESKFRSRDQRPVKLQTFEFSPFAPDTAGEMVAAIGLIERWTGMSFLAASGSGAAGAAGGTAEEDFVLLGRKILDECEGEPDFEVCARKVENSSRPALVVKPRRARESYYEMLVWYAGKAILDYAISRGGLGDVFESLRRDLADPRTADGDPRLGQAWENLGGQLVPMSRLEVLLGMAERGELNTWKEMHAEYAVLSAHYARDKARHAWETVRMLPGLRAPTSLRQGDAASPDGEGRGEDAFMGAPLARGDMEFLFRSLSALTHRVEKEVLASRRKDFQNHFRKATSRSEAEMKAVLGTVENNAFVKSTKIAMAAMRDDIDRILGALLA
jgi:NDP-sugar pyrophosphorylase family protein